MKLTEHDQYIVKKYEQDEQMMVLIFAQFCVNQDLDAMELYTCAYPNQVKNKVLQEALENTVPKAASEEITLEVVLHVLDLFGNDDLAFVVQDAVHSKK